MTQKSYKEKVEKVIEEAKKKYHDNDKIMPILDRGTKICVENPKNGILITGINPSFVENGTPDTYTFIDADTKRHLYWRRLHDMMGQEHLSDAGYFDLFPLRVSKQADFESIIPDDLKVELLRLAHEEIARLNPKLIIVHNRRSLAYWGVLKKYTWMGYEFDDVDEPVEGKELKITRITAASKESDRIITSKALVNMLVVQYALYDERHYKKYPQKILNRAAIAELLKIADSK